MKRNLFPSVVTILVVMLVAPMALAVQVSPGNEDADINNDGQVTETELKFFNRNERGA